MAAVKKNTSPDAPTFESALSELEGIIRQLERDNLTLDQSLACFEDGVRLMRFCDGRLKNAQGKLMELVKGDNGEIITKVLGESLESFTGGGETDG